DCVKLSTFRACRCAYRSTLPTIPTPRRRKPGDNAARCRSRQTHCRRISTVNAPSRLMPQCALQWVCRVLESGSVHRRLVMRRKAATSRDKRSFLSPFILGLGIWIGFPTVAALQDMASLVSGVEGEGARWNAFVEKSAAGSVHAAKMPFADGDVTTASMSG